MKQKLRDLDRAPAARYDGHHPRPQSQIRAAMSKRRLAGPWLALVNGPVLFSDWKVDDRYSSDGCVTAAKYAAWKTTTDRLFMLAGIR